MKDWFFRLRVDYEKFKPEDRILTKISSNGYLCGLEIKVGYSQYSLSKEDLTAL